MKYFVFTLEIYSLQTNFESRNSILRRAPEYLHQVSSQWITRNTSPVKTALLILCMSYVFHVPVLAQSGGKSDPVVEGGKLIVELVKAFGSKKDTEKDPGCKGNYADLCIDNKSLQSITVGLHHRYSDEKRELVILPESRECFLQARIGVWTYDLMRTGTDTSIRKGDVMIEGCHHLVMQIK